MKEMKRHEKQGLISGVIDEALADAGVQFNPRNRHRLIRTLVRLSARLAMESGLTVPVYAALVAEQVQREAKSSHPAHIVEPIPDRTLN
jgi:hypothetical protein